MKQFLKRLFCQHCWSNEMFKVPMPVGTVSMVGLKDWRTTQSWWGCVKCGQVSVFNFDFIPINYDPHRDHAAEE